MRYLLMTVVLGVAGYFAWNQFKPRQAPPPPPPPPAILTEPAPLISPDEQAKVVRSASDQNSEVRWQAIIFLDKMKVPVAFDVMFEKMRKDPDVELRIKIIGLLGQRGAQKVTVTANSNDPLSPTYSADPTSREQRVSEISQHLVAAAKDSIPEIRIAALQALEVMGDYSVASAVTDSLKDPDEKVRLQALRTLNTLQDKKAALIEAERRRQEELRRKAEESAKSGLPLQR
ncbi:MAG: HEAT repeat domain-containing protein [Elusimicrobia bacterium]|nr:HEAT repeat domain-containing protein [Elusimicrobiota bacterium]